MTVAVGLRTAALNLADIGSVKPDLEAELFLAPAFRLAQFAYIDADQFAHIHIAYGSVSVDDQSTVYLSLFINSH